MREVEHDNKWTDDAPVDEVDTEQPLDAMSPEIAPGLALIEQLRIYDVLMGMYREMNKDSAERLEALHAEGRIVGPLPFME